MTGEGINCISELTNNCAYVLVMPSDTFQPLKYSEKFKELQQDMIRRRLSSNQNQPCCNTNYSKCQSSPAIPSSCRKTSTVRFTPCVESESSEEECPCDLSPKDSCQLYRNKKNPPPRQPKVKKGFFAKCCPCCVKAPPNLCPSKPMLECGYGKMTQTTAADFKCAVNRMKRAKAEEKKREKLYKRATVRKRDPHCHIDERPLYCPSDDTELDLADPKFKKKLEEERRKFYKKRMALEKKIFKQLEKKYAKILKYGDC